jgi:hypothetical protein
MREAIRKVPRVVWALLALSIAFEIISVSISYEIANYQHQGQATGACQQAEAKPLVGTREQSGETETQQQPGDQAKESYLARCWAAKIADEANELAARQLRLDAFNSVLGGLSTVLAAWAIIAALIATRSDMAAGRGRVIPESPAPTGTAGATQVIFRNLGPGGAHLRGYRSLALIHTPGQRQIRDEVRQTAEPMSVVLAAGETEVVLLPTEALPGQVLLVVAHYSDDIGSRHAWRLFQRDTSGTYVGADYCDGYCG